MNSKIATLFLLIVSFLSIAQSPDEAKIAEAVESLRKAMIDADAAQLASLTSESLSYGHSSGTIEDKKTFIETIVSAKNDFISIEQTSQTISINNGVAIVRHKFVGDMLISGNPGKPTINILQVWQKEKGKWKLVARQAFR